MTGPIWRVSVYTHDLGLRTNLVPRKSHTPLLRYYKITKSADASNLFPQKEFGIHHSSASVKYLLIYNC